MALGKSKPVAERDAREFGDLVKQGVVIYSGALVALDATGNVMPADTIANGARVVRGIALDGWDNRSGTDGTATIRSRRGCFSFRNSAGADEVTAADIGTTAYVLDDETVARADGGAARIAAGVVRAVDPRGVWVELP